MQIHDFLNFEFQNNSMILPASTIYSNEQFWDLICIILSYDKVKLEELMKLLEGASEYFLAMNLLVYLLNWVV